MYVPQGHVQFCDHCHRARIVCDASGDCVKPAPPALPPILKRYGVQYCGRCGFALEFCACARG